MGQAIPQFFQGVAGHVRTFVTGAGDAGHRVITVLRIFALHLPHHVGFRGHEKISRFSYLADIVQHRFRAADEIAVLADIGRAFGMRQGDGARQAFLRLQQIADAKDFMNDAGSVPQNHLTARHFLEWDPLESTCRHASLSIL